MAGHIVDVKRAIAWVRDNIADYGGDPDYLVVTGGSAGGHLAALAALTPGDPAFQPGFEEADTSVQAAVPFYGVYDFAGSTGLANAIGMRDAFLGPRVLQTTWQDAPDVYEAASPILRVSRTVSDTNRRPVQHVVAQFRPDLYQIKLDLHSAVA